jgi:hypothetical protein
MADRTPSKAKERRNTFPSGPLGRRRTSQAGSREEQMSDGEVLANGHGSPDNAGETASLKFAKDFPDRTALEALPPLPAKDPDPILH